MDDTRTCPHCAEDIRPAARVCKHCGRDVEPIEPIAVEDEAADVAVEDPADAVVVGWSGVGWMAFLFGLVIVAVAVCTQGDEVEFGSEPPPFPPAAPAAPLVETVVYEVTGRGRVSLTIQNDSGGADQLSVRLPWERTLRMSPGAFTYVAAQKEQGDTQPVTCTIRRNGAQVARASANAPYGIATCSD